MNQNNLKKAAAFPLKPVCLIGMTAILAWQHTVFPIPAIHGKLKVVNNRLCSSSGIPVQLKGMSTHGLQWYGGYVTSGAISTLKNDWKATVVRAAMYIDEGGYATNSSVKQKVIDCINLCGELGIYCIIDWHILKPGDPNVHRSLAKDFFKEMATKYGDRDNILYELCNEPNGVPWSSVKSYADTIINVIRPIDPNTVIIVGTPNWSQYVDEAAEDPLNYSNIMYTLHFYSGTHGQSLRNRATGVLTKIPLFVTEWGTSQADGQTGLYLEESRKWLDWCDTNCLSWCNWSLSDGGGTSNALAYGASKNGGWTTSQLSASGQFVRDAMRRPQIVAVAPFRVPIPRPALSVADIHFMPCFTLTGRKLGTNTIAPVIKLSRDCSGKPVRIIIHSVP